MRSLQSFLNKIVIILNVLLAGLLVGRPYDLKHIREKNIPLWLNTCILLLLGFISFCFFYAPYLRDRALGIH